MNRAAAFIVLACPVIGFSQTPSSLFGRGSSAGTAAFLKGVNQDTKVTVQVLQRNLDLPLGLDAVAKDKSSGVFVHTQIIVKDGYGKVLEDIGYFEDGGAREDAPDHPEYEAVPLFEATCSYADYIAAKNTVADENAKYSALAFSRQQATKDDSKNKMTLLVWEQNCQAFSEALSMEVSKRPSAEVQKEFRPPGSPAQLAMTALQMAGIVGDAREVEAPVVNTAVASAPVQAQSVQPVQTASGTVNAAPAFQTQTVDNTAMKAQASALLENAHQYASGIAADAGVGAEYQSAVAPVMSQGRAAISSIPDQQTVSVPVGSAQGGGYSSEIMDQVGTAFAEQGPCSAGFLLESLKNQSK